MKAKSLIILALVVVPLITVAVAMASFHNDDVSLRNDFTQKFSERTTNLNKMKTIFAQKAKVAVRNDSAFTRNIGLIMNARADQSDQLLMKWVQESNPNADFKEVSALYRDLSRAIEQYRNEFEVQEKYLQDIKREHDNLVTRFPGNMLAGLMGREKIDYKPILMDETAEAVRTGRDNDVEVF